VSVTPFASDDDLHRRFAQQRVVRTVAREHDSVGAATAIDGVILGVDVESVIAHTADCGIDPGAEADSNVVDHTVGTAELSRIQIHNGGGGKTG
jgi:hypothetical protein